MIEEFKALENLGEDVSGDFKVATGEGEVFDFCGSVFDGKGGELGEAERVFSKEDVAAGFAEASAVAIWAGLDVFGVGFCDGFFFVNLGFGFGVEGFGVELAPGDVAVAAAGFAPAAGGVEGEVVGVEGFE